MQGEAFYKPKVAVGDQVLHRISRTNRVPVGKVHLCLQATLRQLAVLTNQEPEALDLNQDWPQVILEGIQIAAAAEQVDLASPREQELRTAHTGP